jgi:predicted kinase
MTTRTYAELGRLARRELERGGGVIVDATFHRRAQRGAFRGALGDRVPGALVIVDCRASRGVLVARAQRRESDPGHVSDAGEQIVQMQLAAAEPANDWDAPGLELWTEAPLDDLVVEVEGFLDRSLPERGRGSGSN